MSSRNTGGGWISMRMGGESRYVKERLVWKNWWVKNEPRAKDCQRKEVERSIKKIQE